MKKIKKIVIMFLLIIISINFYGDNRKKNMPEWSFKDIYGNLINSKDFNDKILIIDLFSILNQSHFVEIIKNINKNYKNRNVIVIGFIINLTPSKPLDIEQIKSFVEYRNINYPIIIPDRKFINNFGKITQEKMLITIPTTFIFDYKKNLYNYYGGILEVNDLIDDINSINSNYKYN